MPSTLIYWRSLIDINDCRAVSVLAIAFCCLLACDSSETDHQYDVGDTGEYDVGDSGEYDVGDVDDSGEYDVDDVGEDANSTDDVGDEDTGPTGPEDCEADDGDFGITDVIGDIDDGLSVVVCGNDFGDQGPSYVLFDDMESGQAGEPVEESSPHVGQWWQVSTSYSDGAGRSGEQAMTIGGSGSGNAQFGIVDEDEELGLMHFDEIFVSWALLDLGVFPGDNSSETEFSTDSSAKDVWVMYGDRGDNYSYSCSQGTCNGNDIVLVSHTGNGGFKIDGNNTNSNWWISGLDFWQFETWNPMSVYLNVDSEDPYGPIVGAFEHISPEGGYIRDDYDGTIMREEHDEVPPVWDRIKFGSWHRSTDGFDRIVDDIYIAIGDGAPARVEIADAPVIEDATKLAISTIDDWSDERLEATLRLGDLNPEDDDLYLYVVDADNQRSAGFALQ